MRRLILIILFLSMQFESLLGQSKSVFVLSVSNKSENLNLSGKKIDKLKVEGTLSGVFSIDLSNNPISDFDFSAQLPDLSGLYLESTRIIKFNGNELSPIRRLNITSNFIDPSFDISMFQNAEKIILGNKIKTVKSTTNLLLTDLTLIGPVDDFSFLSNLEGLDILKVVAPKSYFLKDLKSIKAPIYVTKLDFTNLNILSLKGLEIGLEKRVPGEKSRVQLYLVPIQDKRLWNKFWDELDYLTSNYSIDHTFINFGGTIGVDNL